MKVNQIIVEYLKRIQVEVLFGIGGANIEDLYDAVFHFGKGISVVTAKHEFSAATMADGYSRLSGKLGVVISTSGGGALNLVAGLAESFASGVPVLALVGQVPTFLEGKGGFQDQSGLNGSINAQKLFSSVSKFCWKVNHPDEVEEKLDQAVEAALSGRPGPSVLLLPKNVQTSEVEAPNRRLILPSKPQLFPIATSLLDKAFARLQKGGRTVIICGDRVSRTNSQNSVETLAQILNADVAVTPEGKASFEASHPCYCGQVGIMGNPEVMGFIREADTVILIGTQMAAIDSYEIERFLSEKAIIHIDTHRSFLDRNWNFINLVGSISGTLELLIGRFKNVRDRYPGVKPSQSSKRDRPSQSNPSHQNSNSGSLEKYLATLQNQIEHHSNIFVDAGNVGAFTTHFLKLKKGSSFTLAMGMGGMGYTFGAAIGGNLANRKKTYVIAGDGAFFMHGLEIHTARELHLPITFIIFNNNAHGMCVTRESIYFNANYSFNTFTPSRFAEGVKKMFPSLESFSAENPIEFENILIKTKNANGPVFISVDINLDEIPPFRPFLSQLQKSPSPNRRP